LLINTAALNTAKTKEASQIANELLARLRFMSRQKGIDLRLVRDPFQAAQILEELEVGQGLTNV
jgi:hypothetical protein